MVIDDVKRFLFEYYRQRHFDLMPPEVRDRYDDYAKKKDFNGNMKWWAAELEGQPLPTLDVAKQEDLFNLLQNALQGMDADKKKYSHNKPVNDFIEKWFGTFKPFDVAKSVPGVDAAFAEIHRLISDPAHKSAWEKIFKNNGFVSDDFSFDDLIDALAGKKYNKNVNARNVALQVADYVINYSQYYGIAAPLYAEPSMWPLGARLTRDDVFTSLGLPGDRNDWFKAHFDQPKFEAAYPIILDELLTKENVRKEFAKYERTGKVIGQLDKAIEATDYENPESKDYVPPKPKDEKNIAQVIKSWKDDTYESYLRKFKELGRGTRLYFSPFSQEIIKAIDKEKVKPTDGIAGILDKKDKILGRVTAASPTAKKHFEWFAKTLDKIGKQVPNAFAGAMKGGRQLQDVVSQIIIAAVKNNNVDEAKTALELLAVCKYGFTTSKTMDALAKEDLTIFSDKGLSWNKNNEVMQGIGKAVDKTLKLGIQAVGRTAAAVRNTARRGRAKFNGDIRTNPDLDKAYKQWVAEDQNRYNSEVALNNAHGVDAALADLAAGHGRSGRVIDASTIDAEKTALDAMAPGTAGYDELKEDIEKYESFRGRKDLVDNWRSKNKDNYKELVAYWDLMMSAMKTHSFNLSTLKIRKAFLANNAGRAKNVVQQYTSNYGTLTY